MTFVAAPGTAPAIAVDDTIVIDGFYPPLSIVAFRDAQRMPAAVTDGRARDALVGAVMTVSMALANWRGSPVAAGVAKLAEVVGPINQPATIGGEPRAVVLWRRAVYAFAAADLADTQTDITATDKGRDRREERAVAADDLRRTGTAAIRDLLGRTRSKVALV